MAQSLKKTAVKGETRNVYRTKGVVKKNTFIVISKKELRLYVYENVNDKRELVASYPVCLSKNKGNKQRRGDMKTPESTMNNPFSITQIQDASGWTHNFKDGRGSIKAYGHWFLRLRTPGHSGIGIHGSTNNRSSVPGRASEGCIRLLDEDIIHLKENYAFVGQKVVIKGENDGPLDWEIAAWNRAGNRVEDDIDKGVKEERYMVTETGEIIQPLDGPSMTRPSEGVAVTGKNVRLRTEPLISDNTLYRVNGEAQFAPSQAVMPLLGEQGDWFRVLYDGQELYVSKKYSKVVPMN